MEEEVFLTEYNPLLPIPTTALKKVDQQRRETKLFKKMAWNRQSSMANFGHMKFPEQEIQRIAYHKTKRQQSKHDAMVAAAKKKHAKAKWKHVLLKSTYPEPGRDYYKNSPIQPGFNFFKALFHAKKVPITKLNLRMPEILFIDEHI